MQDEGLPKSNKCEQVLIVCTICIHVNNGNIHIKRIFFVVFIGASYNRCLWIYKIIRFSYCFVKGWVVVRFAGWGFTKIEQVRTSINSMYIVTLFKNGRGGGYKDLPTSFSTTTSTNVGTSPQNFLNVNFNPFATLFKISRPYLVSIPNC